MKRLSSAFIFSGLILIAVSINIVFFTFYPVIWAQLKYTLTRPNQNIEVTNIPSSDKNVINPIDENFGIVIPKIGANSKIIADVDPYNEKIYQLALTHGVAHARGSVLPDENGNMFLFSHSSVNFYEAVRYNSVFYLLTKVERGDNVYIFYKKQKFKYSVTDKKIVDAAQISYLSPGGNKKTLTLMTCWPAGTTLRRLVVIGELER